MRYIYKARTKEGKIQKGTIEASSRKAALYLLEKYGLYATYLKSSSSAGFLSKEITIKRISPKNVIMFTRQFSVMLKAGIPPVEALKSQIKQTNNPVFRDKLLRIAEMVEGGSSLSQAFSAFPDVFNSFYINVVRSGEATGRMAESLSYLSSHIERDYNFRQKIKGAMIYPVFIIVAFILVFFLAVFFIIPKLSTVLTGLSNNLPITTKAMIYLSEKTRKGGWVAIILAMIFLFVAPLYLKRFEWWKKWADRIMLKTPILGTLQKKIHLTKFAENLSVLISSGLPITQALDITEGIMDNYIYKKIIAEAKDNVAKGEKISTVFLRYPKEIPSFVSQMIATGEETGRLETTLTEVVNFYRQEVETMTDNLANMIEPILILLLGGMVGVLAVSVFVPLFKVGAGVGM